MVEIADRRVVIAAITDSAPGFAAPATATGHRWEIAPLLSGGAATSFVLVRVARAEDPAAVAAAISVRTGLKTLTEAVARSFGTGEARTQGRRHPGPARPRGEPDEGPGADVGRTAAARSHRPR